jgi:hypothetical protein
VDVNDETGVELLSVVGGKISPYGYDEVIELMIEKLEVLLHGSFLTLYNKSVMLHT